MTRRLQDKAKYFIKAMSWKESPSVTLATVVYLKTHRHTYSPVLRDFSLADLQKYDSTGPMLTRSYLQLGCTDVTRNFSWRGLQRFFTSSSSWICIVSSSAVYQLQSVPGIEPPLNYCTHSAELKNNLCKCSVKVNQKFCFEKK